MPPRQSRCRSLCNRCSTHRRTGSPRMYPETYRDRSKGTKYPKAAGCVRASARVRLLGKETMKLKCCSRAMLLAAIAPMLASTARGQAVPSVGPPRLESRASADLPSAPEPQTPSQTAPQQKPQPSTPPSLQDLGISPDQARADRDEQRRLDVRSHDLKVHQTLGLITLAPIAAACLTSGLAPPDPRSGNNEIGRDVHVALGSASVALYGATAWYAIKAPRIAGQGPTKGGIRIHKYLVAIHAPGMILTPILGAMAYNQAANGQKVTGIASAHGAVALITAGSYAASILAVSWPIHFPGHHSKQVSQPAGASIPGEQQ